MKRERAYRRINYDDRLKIEALYNSAHTLHHIADYLGFAVSTIHAEVHHGLYLHMGAELTRRPYHYSADIAQDYANFQATSKGTPVKIGHNHSYANLVASLIKQGVSPDVIVGSLRRKGLWTVSTPTLYRYIDKGYIPGVSNKLLIEKPLRKRKYYHVQKAAHAPKGLSISRRPAAIDARTTFGHWEMDSVVGKSKGAKQSILVLTERLTRFEIIFRADAKSSAATVRALDKIIPCFPPHTFQTITVDNGSEFQDCDGMEHTPDGKRRLTVYYCHPYTSCERGSNERANRIIRRYFHKGESLYRVTQADCDRVAASMNNMPRRIFDYATAAELFDQNVAKLKASQ